MTTTTVAKKKKLSVLQQRKAEWKAALRKYNLKLEDAKEPLELHVKDSDNTKGKKLDSGFCALHRRGKLEHGIEELYVGNKVAGAIRKVRGKWVAERYVLPQNVMVAIKAFDFPGGKMPVATYKFLAPTGGRTLAAQKRNAKKAQKDWRKLSPARKAAILAKRTKRKAAKRRNAPAFTVHTRGFGEAALRAA